MSHTGSWCLISHVMAAGLLKEGGCEPEPPALHLKLVSLPLCRLRKGQRGNCDCGKLNKVSDLGADPDQDPDPDRKPDCFYSLLLAADQMHHFKKRHGAATRGDT